MLITSGSYRVNSGTKSYLNPIQPNIRMHILYTVLYTFLKGADRRFSNQQLLYFVIISFILITLKSDSGVIS